MIGLIILLLSGCCLTAGVDYGEEDDGEVKDAKDTKVTKIFKVAGEETGLIVHESFVAPGPPKILTEVIADFNHFVFSSDLIVDKSALIKEFMEENDKVIVVSCPRQWGKTLNLLMIKSFFEIHVNEKGIKIAKNLTAPYNLFLKGEVTEDNVTKKLTSPFFISKDKNFIEKHIGRCPVVYIDLSRTFTHKTTKEVGIAVSKMFNDHKYVLWRMEEALNSTNTPDNIKEDYKSRIKLFNMYWNMDKKLTNEQQIDSIVFLCKVIQNHFNQKVIVLIDRFHVPWEDVFYSPVLSGKYKAKFFTFYEAFMRKTLKDNPYLKKAMLTGTPLLPNELTFNVRESNAITGKFMEYFGFNEFEIEKLFNYLQIPKETQDEAHKWYKGYKMNKMNFHIYNPLSIVEYLSTNKFVRYWVKSGRSDLAKNLLAIQSFRNRFRLLLEGHDITIVRKERHRFTWQELEQLYHLRLNKNKIEYEEEFAETGLMELFVQGYLTLASNLTKGKYEYPVRFPNTEISGSMKWDLQLFYTGKFGIPYTLKDTIKQEFEKFINNNETHSLDLKNSLTSFLNSTKLTNGTSNECVLRMMVCFLALDMNATRRATYEVDDDERPDTVLILDERAIAINVKPDKPSAQEVLDEVKSILIDERMLQSIKVTKYIGISVSQDKSVDIKGEVVQSP